MRLFIDSAKIEEIKAAKEMGCSGCTTNPTLIKEAVDELRRNGKDIDMEKYIKQICRTVGRGNPVSLEVISLDFQKMVKEAKILWKKFNHVENNVVIKVPVSTVCGPIDVNFDGIRAIIELEKIGIKTNATLIMKPEQALLAQKASYISPFVGRIDDYIRDQLGISYKKSDYFLADGFDRAGIKFDDDGIVSGVDLIWKIMNIFRAQNLKSQIIAASIRNSRQLREVAETGAPIATVPFYVIAEMFKHKKTIEGVLKFSKDTIEEYKDIFS